MRVCAVSCVYAVAFTWLLGCNASPHRPAKVPASATWTDGVFIECLVQSDSHANRCTVYDGTSGEVQVSGLFVLSGTGREAERAELQYAAFDGTRILLRDARTLDPVRLTEFVVPGMQKRLATLAGPEALDCGRAMRNRMTKVVSDCALKAFADKRAFYVSYDERGWGTGYSLGYAGDSSGNLFFVEYSNSRWPIHPLPEGILLSEGDHVMFGPCPKPPMLIKSPTGELSCVPPRE